MQRRDPTWHSARSVGGYIWAYVAHVAPSSVMRGHSRSKNGVLTHAYDPRIHVFPDPRRGWPEQIRP
jgi:hypothetical protein